MGKMAPKALSGVSKVERPHVPAIYLFLLKMLTSPPTYSGDVRRIPETQTLANRLYAIRFARWKRMMGHNCPELLSILPRLMLLGINQRACVVHCLKGMQISTHVDFSAQNMPVLRRMFLEIYRSGRTFALEFNSCDNRILVVKFIPRNNTMFMRTHIFDRINGVLRKTREHEVLLTGPEYQINLDVQIDKSSSALASFFYYRHIYFPFDRDTGDFDLECYSLVTFWTQNELIEKTNSKRRKLC
jgi:hypothetical protein